MNEVTITAAPQVYISDGLYWKWMESHTGSEEDFLRFLTSPSIERDAFLRSIDCEVRVAEGIGTANYSI